MSNGRPTKKIQPFEIRTTEAICDVLAATEYPGLSTSEINSALRQVRLDLDEGPNKRKRLLTTLQEAQARQEAGNALVAFVNAAMDLSRYVEDHDRFSRLQGQLNEVLSLFGYRVTDQGKFATGRTAATLNEAAELSGQLQSELRRRKCHPVLLAYCDEELIRQSLFHAIEEAAKSIPDRLRRHTKRGEDGAKLYNELLGGSDPLVRVTPLVNDSDRSEQRGFNNLLIGIHGHFRNPRAHSSRLGSHEDPQELLEAFSMLSYVHRRLDRAGVAP